MGTADMEAPTHALIEPTTEFNAERLGKFANALVPLEASSRFTTLTSIMLVIEEVGYRAHHTGTRKDVGNVRAIVYHVSPMPVQVAQ